MSVNIYSRLQIAYMFYIFPGDIVLIEVTNRHEENYFITLEKFHKKIRIPNNASTELLLISVIAYKGRGGVSRSIEMNSIHGHYTNFVYRRGNTGWTEADDLSTQTKLVHYQTKIVPRMLVYIKTKKYTR